LNAGLWRRFPERPDPRVGCAAHTKTPAPANRSGRVSDVRLKGLSGLQSVTDLVGDRLEGALVGGHRGQDLAVQFDAGFAETVDELRIGEAFLTGGGVDALDPQGAEVALLGAAVAVGVLPGAVNGGLGGADGVLAAAVETLGLLREPSCVWRGT
jgi:hypothetical protein